MRPRLITVPKIILFLLACGFFGGLAYWIKAGMPLPGSGVPSTAGKIAFVSDRSGGHNDLYMADAGGSGQIVALTDDAADDNQPAWSSTGSGIAFTSANRKGVSPQVFIVDAKPGATVLPVTNTSPSKDQPTFGAENRIYYLDSGKLNAADPSASDFDALLPAPDLRMVLVGNENQPGLFYAGGLVRAVVSPDGSRILGVLKGEQAESLILYQHDGNQLAVLGFGKNVFPAFRPDGGWAAVFVDGGPLPQPVLLLSDELMKSDKFVPPGPLPLRAQEGVHTLVTWDKTGTASPPSRLPAAPNALAVSPDGTRAALSFEQAGKGANGSGGAGGVIVVPLGTAGSVQPAFNQPARTPTWSPDGTKLAVVSGTDIWVVSADGSGTPLNLTQGKGNNSAPAWSPALSKKQQEKNK